MAAEQKVAVITGASRSIGAALVKAYRERGCRVVATARSIKPSNDAETLVIPSDIAERKTAKRAISEGLVRFGRIDTPVNNAGIFIAKPFTQYTQADHGLDHGWQGRQYRQPPRCRAGDSADRRMSAFDPGCVKTVESARIPGGYAAGA